MCVGVYLSLQFGMRVATFAAFAVAGCLRFLLCFLLVIVLGGSPAELCACDGFGYLLLRSIVAVWCEVGQRKVFLFLHPLT